MQTQKPWYLSKTVLVNMIGGLCVALSAAIPALASVNAFLVANASMIAMGWSVLNVALRFITKDKISLGE